jgi:hypothetical protein
LGIFLGVWGFFWGVFGFLGFFFWFFLGEKFEEKWAKNGEIDKKKDGKWGKWVKKGEIDKKKDEKWENEGK